MEKEIIIFKLSPTIKDGGSIHEIVTNVGIFSLKRKLGDPVDYFYDERGLIKDSDTCKSLRKAINVYNKNKSEEMVEKAVRDFNFMYNSFGYEAGKIKK